MIWKKGIPTPLLIKELRIPFDDGSPIHYREEKDKLYLKHFYLQTIVPLDKLKQYIVPVVVNGKIVECSKDLSDSIEENFQKNKNKK